MAQHDWTSRDEATRLGVEHETSAPALEESGAALRLKHPLHRARDVLRVTEGMISAHNNVAAAADIAIPLPP